MKLIVGAHMPIAGGLSAAVSRSAELGLPAFQIFTRSPRGWSGTKLSRESIDQFKSLKDDKYVSVNSHMPYLTNFASPTESIYKMSIESLKEELRTAAALELNHVVLHPGSHLGKGLAFGKNRVAAAIKMAIDNAECKCNVLLENMAGQGNSVGSRFHDLGDILSSIDDKRVGICLDTCHAYAAGYDIVNAPGLHSMLDEINKYIGLGRIKLVHLNDSKSRLGGGLDRHEKIGQGYIGAKGFKLILSDLTFANLPLILETPVNDYHEYLGEIRAIDNIISDGTALKV
ncbi:MAG: deoxyribonuclease IV [Nitrososphaerota archaeon]|jgi:deoxyribonuclease-4|nr:deoxyribonuclease IV [Nitrososphaerota archaeon]MDG6929928.1 deoxyribonuclease IV [Nitrososphaerota archaeon]MDG6931622.1 deoxyribonuclease IV [Nitrososphaerota archaeon]MDG6935961.1 deoxyribonuclease IV [Nitrososphaerota archaeon]MDG6943985.1 deoxyribonuclease IV [Nitrososphaerota archaeon]